MKIRVYKIFKINDKGILSLFTGTNFKSEAHAQEHALKSKTDMELAVLMVYINSKDT